MLDFNSGMDLQFEWEEVKAFVRQPDGSLFSWCERFQCYHHLLYGIVRYFYIHQFINFFGALSLCTETEMHFLVTVHLKFKYAFLGGITFFFCWGRGGAVSGMGEQIVHVSLKNLDCSFKMLSCID